MNINLILCMSKCLIFEVIQRDIINYFFVEFFRRILYKLDLFFFILIFLCYFFFAEKTSTTFMNFYDIHNSNVHVYIYKIQHIYTYTRDVWIICMCIKHWSKIDLISVVLLFCDFATKVQSKIALTFKKCMHERKCWELLNILHYIF